jgi:GNAT superfamily N-acetyltransferase
VSREPWPALPDGWRPLTKADLTDLLRLEGASDAADGERFPTTRDDLASLLFAPAFDLERMSVAIDGGDALLGWCGLEPRIGGEVWNRIHVHGSVHPAARGQGLGRRLLEWAEHRSPSVFEAEDGAQPALPDVLTVHASETATARARLQDRSGYRLVRWYSDMFRSLAPPLDGVALPDGYRFISWSLDRDNAFHAADVDAFRDHWGSPRFSVEAWRHEYADDEGFRPELSVGVERAGDVVGYVMVASYAGIEDEEGRRVAWLARLGVRRDHRGQGIGAAAITRALRLACEAGFATAGLDVDTESLTGALRLYQRLGFYPVKRLALRSKTTRPAMPA